MAKSSSAKKYSIKLLPLLMTVVVIALLGFVGLKLLGPSSEKNTSNTSSKGTPRPVNSVDYSPATTKDNTANEDRKSNNNPSQTLDNTISKSSNLSVKIVSKNNLDNNTIHIGTLVQGATNGTCTLTASQSGTEDIVKSASVQQDVSYYSCGVFNIQLPKPGTWSLKLVVYANGATASDSTTVSL